MIISLKVILIKILKAITLAKLIVIIIILIKIFKILVIKLIIQNKSRKKIEVMSRVQLLKTITIFLTSLSKSRIRHVIIANQKEAIE